MHRYDNKIVSKYQFLPYSHSREIFLQKFVIVECDYLPVKIELVYSEYIFSVYLKPVFKDF